MSANAGYLASCRLFSLGKTNGHNKMNIEIKERFMAAWEKHFPCSELPIVCYYSNELGDVKFPDQITDYDGDIPLG